MLSKYKYGEDILLSELANYIESTYKKHYAGSVQPMELVIENGDGLGFCRGAVIKYVCRYGKKNGKDRTDIMKALHYNLMLLYIHDRDNLNTKTSQAEQAIKKAV